MAGSPQSLRTKHGSRGQQCKSANLATKPRVHAVRQFFQRSGYKQSPLVLSVSVLDCLRLVDCLYPELRLYRCEEYRHPVSFQELVLLALKALLVLGSSGLGLKYRRI